LMYASSILMRLPMNSRRGFMNSRRSFTTCSPTRIRNVGYLSGGKGGDGGEEGGPEATGGPGQGGNADPGSGSGGRECLLES